MGSGSMTMHPRCPGGGTLGCRLSLKTAILKRPKSYVVEWCNLYKKTVCGPSLQLDVHEPLENLIHVAMGGCLGLPTITENSHPGKA